jgi:hypothetical protein
LEIEKIPGFGWRNAGDRFRLMLDRWGWMGKRELGDLTAMRNTLRLLTGWIEEIAFSLTPMGFASAEWVANQSVSFLALPDQRSFETRPAYGAAALR